MEIGGKDVIVSVILTLSRLYQVLSVIRVWWPEAEINDAKNAPLFAPLRIPCEVHVHKNAGIRQLADEKGVIPEVEPFYFTIYAHDTEVTFVVGPEGSEGDLIVQDLTRLLRLSPQPRPDEEAQHQ